MPSTPQPKQIRRSNNYLENIQELGYTILEIPNATKHTSHFFHCKNMQNEHVFIKTGTLAEIHANIQIGKQFKTTPFEFVWTSGGSQYAARIPRLLQYFDVELEPSIKLLVFEYIGGLGTIYSKVTNYAESTMLHDVLYLLSGVRQFDTDGVNEYKSTNRLLSCHISDDIQAYYIIFDFGDASIDIQ